MHSDNLIFISSPWASGHIRGVQVADKLGAKCDPKGGVSLDDIFIFIKITPNIDIPRMYIDIIDAYGLLTSLSRFPDARLIVISRLAQEFIANRTYQKVILIPEHHCNFENDIRDDREVKIAGFIGYPSNFGINPLTIKEELAKIGIDFIWDTEFRTRQDVCDFYKKIDIQVTFRPKSPTQLCAPELKNPLKLENAGSFKVPSICCAEPSYIDEFKDCFLIAENVKDIIKQCEFLKNDSLAYKQVSEACHARAQDYHIDKIIPQYEQLKNWDLDTEPTGELLEIYGYEMGSSKLFQIKDKEAIIANCKLITRTIKVAGENYNIGGIREFDVNSSHRLQGVGRLLFSDLVSYATNAKLDMLVGFSRDGALTFFSKCGCGLLEGCFNGQAIFCYPISIDYIPLGPVDLMGTTW